MITGKHALVTGGGTGVGRAIALALAETGVAVTICGRRKEQLAAVADANKRKEYDRGGGPFVARRVGGVEADQLPQQLGGRRCWFAHPALSLSRSGRAGARLH